MFGETNNEQQADAQDQSLAPTHLPRVEAANETTIETSGLIRRRLAEERQLEKLQQLRDSGEIAQEKFDIMKWLKGYPKNDEPPLTQAILNGRALVLTREEMEALQCITLKFPNGRMVELDSDNVVTVSIIFPKDLAEN